MKVFVFCKRISFLALAALSPFLAGCGGGGGSAAAVAVSTSNFALDAAYVDNMTIARNIPWTVRGTFQGVPVTGSGTLVESAATASTFNGKSAQARNSNFNGTISAQGQSAPISVVETTFLDASRLVVGSGGTAGTAYNFIIQSAPLPNAAKVGSSGAFVSYDIFRDALKSVKVSSSVVTWSLEADTASTALLTFFTKATATTGAVTTTAEVLRITPSGVTTRVRVDGNVNGQALSFFF